MSAPRLKSFIERIERLREEKKAIGGDERDVFAEAKGEGYDNKAMREVLKRRAMGAAELQEWDALVDLYESSLGTGKKLALDALREGKTVREAAEAGGIAVGAVANLRKSVHETGNREHEDGEVHETQEREQAEQAEPDLTIPAHLDRRHERAAT